MPFARPILATAVLGLCTGLTLAQDGPQFLTGEFQVENTQADIERCAAGSGKSLRYVTAVRFDPPFADPPRVVLSLTDVDLEAVSRLRATAENVTREGVTIVVTAGCSATLWKAGGSWVAVGG